MLLVITKKPKNILLLNEAKGKVDTKYTEL